MYRIGNVTMLNQSKKYSYSNNVFLPFFVTFVIFVPSW